MARNKRWSASSKSSSNDNTSGLGELEEQPVIEIIEGLPKKVVGIAVKGRVTVEDCRDVLMPAMKRSLQRHDKIRLYYELSCRFPGAAWDDLDLGIEHASRCERVAIVTDVAWVRLTVKALRFLIPGEIRVFPTDQAPEGRAWITARPGARTGTETAAPARTLLPPPRRARRSPPSKAQTDVSNYVVRQQQILS
jgi:stage II sporulation SpoAA-like protein